MWSNFTIKNKSRIYFIILSTLIVIISLISIIFVNDIRSKTKELYNHPYQVTYSTKAIQSEIRNLFVIMLRMTNTTDTEDIITLSIANTESEKLIEEQFLVLKSQYQGDIKDIDDLYALYLIGATNRVNVINYMLDGEFQDAYDFVNNMGPENVNVFLSNLYDVEVFAMAKAKQLQDEADQLAMSHTIVITVVALGLISISFTLYTILIRSLYPPLYKMLETIESYKKGENENFLDLERQDELGIIGNSFNEMLIFMKTNEEMQHIKLKLSKLKNMEQLHKTQLLLKASLESPIDIIILSLDTDYKYMYYNQSHYADMKAAYDADVELGNCIFDYMTSKEDIKRIKKNYDKALLGETHTTLEQYGEIDVSYYETIFSPIKNDLQEIIGVSAFARDITERIEDSKKIEKSEKELQVSEKRYRELVHNLEAGVIVHAADTSIIMNNEKACELLGLSDDEIKGKTAIDPTWKFVNEDLKTLSLEEYPVNLVISSGKEIKEMILGVYNPVYSEIVWLSLNGTPFIDEHGEIREVIISFFNVTELKHKKDELTHISYHDQLTGLYNRRFFEEQIKRLNNPRNLPLSIIMGDVNGLKLTNDAFGHQAGDELLKMIGDIILSSIRGNDVAARWGGDEFTILLPNSDVEAAEILISRIQKKIKAVSFEYGIVSISFGVDSKKEEHEDINVIFNSAEEIMYQNKLVEIDSIRGQTINTIMTTLFEKSAKVKEHSMRVSELSASIAKEMKLSKINNNDIKTMGLIHDIGKIVIDLYILEKPGKLTAEERKIIEQHPLSGSRMLNSSHEYARLAAGVLHHHERIDGKGYPNGITGDQIPIESKIIAVADAFDAMTAERPYRIKPLSTEKAIAELQKHSGTQFDKTIVDVFVNKVLGDNKKR